jgi:hypothetical protein
MARGQRRPQGSRSSLTPMRERVRRTTTTYRRLLQLEHDNPRGLANLYAGRVVNAICGGVWARPIVLGILQGTTVTISHTIKVIFGASSSVDVYQALIASAFFLVFWFVCPFSFTDHRDSGGR